MKTLFYVSKRDGYLICRFTDNRGKRSAISTKMIPRKWNQKLQFAERDKEINVLIRKWKEIADTATSLESLKSKINYNSKSIMLTELIDLYCNYRKNLSAGSIQKYKGYKNICVDVSVDQIDKRFIIEQYNKFLIRMSINSAHKRMEQLSYFLNFAVDFDYISKNPAKGLKFDKEDKPIIYLDEAELKRLHDKKLMGRLDAIRDIFLFQCYTAMEYSRLFTYELRKHIDGKIWVHSNRSKSGKKEAVFPLFPKAKAILEKYDYKLPIKSNQKMNEYLKEIQALCGIDKKLHTHLARHTFATTICLKNGVSAESTSKMMGISVMRLLSTYGKILDSRVADETEQFFKDQAADDLGNCLNT